MFSVSDWSQLGTKLHHGEPINRCRYSFDGRWLIRATNYERVYEINEILDGRPNLSSHYLGVHGGEPQF